MPLAPLFLPISLSVANLAMCTAVAEWIVCRFKDDLDDYYAYAFLEAAWAANVDLAYMRFVETRDDDWRGPIRGPVNIAMAIVNNFLFEDRSHPGEQVGWIVQLARHVLPSTEEFDRWRTGVQTRIAAWLPKDEEYFEEGPVVSREAFDLGIEFDPSRIPGQVDSFLRGIDVDANPLLRTAERARSLFHTFRGEPYRYDVRPGDE